MFELYTDGAFSSKTRRGGWAFIVVEDEVTEVHRASGVILDATSQRAELTACLMALRWCREFQVSEPTVVSDSAYLVNCFLDGWWTDWRCAGIKDGKVVKNEDIWTLVFRESFAVGAYYRHIKGHNGTFFNEEADEMAVEAKSLMKQRS